MPLLTGLLACNLTAHYTHGTLKVYLFSIKNLIHCLLLAKKFIHLSEIDTFSKLSDNLVAELSNSSYCNVS